MQFGIWSRAAALLLPVAFSVALSGCAGNINPVTGKPIITPFSSSIEASAGQKASEQLIADYGVYQDTALNAYVDRVGQALAKNTVRKSVKYTFTILDDDEINAFALPGGYVYITRGALNFANSEAEVAAVLGHEIGHVDAFHFHLRLRSRDHDELDTVLSVLLRNSSKNADDTAMAQKLADRATKSSGYSREQEFEADALGIHYLALAGYDPQAMAGALRTEHAKTLLDDGGMKGNPVAHDILALDQSHPATPERVARAEEAAKVEAAKLQAAPDAVSASAAGPKTDRDAYLAAIDGMPFGTDPGEGTVEGNRLVNAALGFSFEAPKDFDLWTAHDGAFGVSRNAVLIIETTDGYTGQSLATHVQSSMMPKTPVADVRPLDIAGYRGATGIATSDLFTARLGAVHDAGKRLYQLVYVAPRGTFDDLDAAFLESLKSFHPLEGAEAAQKPAPRIRIVTVAGGDTVQSLAERMAVKEKKLEWFRVLNGLGAEDALKPGDKVKVVE